MNPISRKILGIILVAGVFLQSSAALAIDIPGGIPGAQQATGISLNQILAASGLSSGRYAACTASGILGVLANSLRRFQEILEGLILQTINTVFQALIQQLIYCRL